MPGGRFEIVERGFRFGGSFVGAAQYRTDGSAEGRIGAPLDEKRDHVLATGRGGDVQRSPSPLAGGIDFGAGIEHGFDDGDIAAFHRPVQQGFTIPVDGVGIESRRQVI